MTRDRCRRCGHDATHHYAVYTDGGIQLACQLPGCDCADYDPKNEG